MVPSYDFAYYLGEYLDAGALLGLFSGVPSGLLGILGYVFTALGLYTIAKRRGIRKAWLSWIPVADVWILGSLSDQYRYVVKGEYKSKRKALLILSILVAVLTAAISIVSIVALVQGISSAMYSVSEQQMIREVMTSLMTIAGLSIPLAGIAIAYAVIRFMALYDVYRSCDPDNSVVFLVLSILFSITSAFFLFFSREKDKGMPPRRRPQPQPQYIPPQPEYVPPQEENKDYL